MKVIRDSAEYHFLSALDKIKINAKGWVALHFALSKNLNHHELLKNPCEIQEKIQSARQKSEVFIDGLTKSIENTPEGYVYIFSDQDVLVLLKAKDDAQQNKILKTYKNIAETLPSGLSDLGFLDREIHKYLKLADRKMLSAQRFTAYHYMADRHRVDTIAIRRERREDPKVLIIEDDRFTAAYTSNILSKDYDLIIARTGEEGLKAYIEHAPDIVFLDIHLPGMNGHETLHAIKAVDTGACVVMLSVDSAHSTILKANKTGAQKFLKKPFSKERLLETVKLSPHVRSLLRSDSEVLH